MTREEIAERIDRVGALLSNSGCYCECDHSPEDHDDDCELCLACLIGDAIGNDTADAVRALPVIATCGECGHLAHYLGTGPSFCGNPHARGNERGLTYIAADDAPPGWCPLRGGAR